MATDTGTAPANREATTKAESRGPWVVDLKSGRVIRREPSGGSRITAANKPATPAA